MPLLASTGERVTAVGEGFVVEPEYGADRTLDAEGFALDFNRCTFRAVETDALA